ncbi:MAG: Ig-like domain-containing protein [Anaerolineae bacterium]
MRGQIAHRHPVRHPRSSRPLALVARGLRHLSRLLAALAVLMACNLAQPAPTPIPTPDLPTVEIIDPPNNVQVIEGTTFAFDVVARDASQGVSKIELYIDEALINQVNPFDVVAAPVFRAQINWTAQGVGLHVVEAIAYRPDGQRSDGALLTIEVIPAP